jgi:hypothetical protein
MSLAIDWPHGPGENGSDPLRVGPMTLAIAWPHEGGENTLRWPLEPGDWHPFDLVTIHQKRDRDSPVERTTVWTRRVRFDSAFDSTWGGYGLLDTDGAMEIWTGKDGGIEKGPASRLPTE